MLFLMLQSIDEFLDKICSRCQNLERFEYNGGVLIDHNISWENPKIPSDGDKILKKLTHIKLQFGFEPRIYVTNSGKNAVIQNFLQYLEAKCPNLKIPILVKVEKSEVWKNDFRSIIFESW